MIYLFYIIYRQSYISGKIYTYFFILAQASFEIWPGIHPHPLFHCWSLMWVFIFTSVSSWKRLVRDRKDNSIMLVGSNSIENSKKKYLLLHRVIRNENISTNNSSWRLIQQQKASLPSRYLMLVRSIANQTRYKSSNVTWLSSGCIFALIWPQLM